MDLGAGTPDPNSLVWAGRHTSQPCATMRAGAQGGPLVGEKHLVWGSRHVLGHGFWGVPWFAWVCLGLLGLAWACLGLLWIAWACLALLWFCLGLLGDCLCLVLLGFDWVCFGCWGLLGFAWACLALLWPLAFAQGLLGLSYAACLGLLAFA